MTQTSGTLSLPAGSKAAGDKLYFEGWVPDTPKAVILLAHGYAEHLARYDYVAQQAMKSGFALYALDHWGHGRSDGIRGYVPSFSVFTDGIAALLAQVESAHPDLPRGLVGHSMGGLIAAHHLLSRQQSYHAAMLSGPALAPGAPPSVIVRLIGQLLSAIAPKTGLIELEAEAISRDPDVVAAYRADPLVHIGKMSARLAAEMLHAMEILADRAGEIRLPLLVMHGSEDRLAAPSGARAFVDKVGSASKEFRLLDGLFHEIFNEPERDAVLSECFGWLNAQLS